MILAHCLILSCWLILANICLWVDIARHGSTVSWDTQIADCRYLGYFKYIVSGYCETWLGQTESTVAWETRWSRIMPRQASSLLKEIFPKICFSLFFIRHMWRRKTRTFEKETKNWRGLKKLKKKSLGKRRKVLKTKDRSVFLYYWA